MIPLAVPNLTGHEREYLNQCIDTTFVSSVGEFVNRLEEMTAEICGTDRAVATSSGTTGIHLALVGCGVKRDDIVIIPTFTFIATANAVSHCGAIPWLMDISAESWTMDESQVAKELKEKTVWDGETLLHRESGRRVAAIMPVYTLGNIPAMEKLRVIADEYRLPLIADAAAALGAVYQGKKLGELADLTVFSFNGNKTITAGGGGAIVGKDSALLAKLKHLSSTARVTAEYDHDMVGYNYRMTNIQAAVGCAQLERLDEFVHRKREIRNFYNDAFSGRTDVGLFPISPETESACWFSGVVLNWGDFETLKAFISKMRDKGIECRSFWKPVHLQKPYKSAFQADSLHTADRLWSRILTLPCSTGITNDELCTVAKSLIEVLEQFRKSAKVENYAGEEAGNNRK